MPKSRSWQDQSIWQVASRMFSDIKVQSRIKELRLVIRDRFEIEAISLIREVRAIAFGDRRKIFDENNQVKDIKDLDDDTAKMVSEIETRQNGKDGEITVTRIKTYDKLAALEKLFKQLGFYESNNGQKRTNVMMLSDEQLQAQLEASKQALLL